MNTPRTLEQKSSAVTLSDMEIFVFPEIMYALVLANIMSPRLWRWRDDPWFDGLERMKPYRRIARLKQYIMDHYIFNLDLETWGLTTKQRELARFRGFIGEDVLRQSNALFGYEGDKYYFDIDIRTHFGLDKFSGDVIPYWKTETVEAMDAFRHKPNYGTGAGECVSLAALYSAAVFVVCRIPLRDIYLMATPLHSQNFIDVDDGILTNNRRLVTKTMWFNGTALSAQARRALENERVTVVTHESGWIHTLYDEATIDPARYAHFSGRLRAYLATDFNAEILGNFLRHNRDIQHCFQLRRTIHGADHFIGLDRVFAYEHGSPYLVADRTREKLLAEIDTEEFRPASLPGRMVLNDLEAFVQGAKLDIGGDADMGRLKQQFASTCLNAEMALDSLRRFCRAEPRLPDPSTRTFAANQEPLGIDLEMDRREIVERLESVRPRNVTADLAFYAYRDLNRTDPEPFLLAAVQRNPVCIEGLKDLDAAAVEAWLRGLPDESIYDEPGRLAQPDEVWNGGRGDGAEKAVLLAGVLRQREPGLDLRLRVDGQAVSCLSGGSAFVFASAKQLRAAEWTVPPAAP